MACDEFGCQQHGTARTGGAFEHDARQVAVVRPALGGGRQRHQFGARTRPDVSHGNPVFVQATVRQGRRHAFVVAVADAYMARGLRHLRDVGQLPRQVRLRRHAHGDRGAIGMLLSWNDLEPMARRLVTVARQIGNPARTVIAADVQRVAHRSTLVPAIARHIPVTPS